MINEDDIVAFQYYNQDQVEDMGYISSFTDFDSYQAFTDQTAVYPEDQGLVYCALGLASEAGEVAGKVKKMIRDGTLDQDELVKELGDVAWYLARTAAELEVYLSDVVRVNVDKLSDRAERGVIQGSGDNR